MASTSRKRAGFSARMIATDHPTSRLESSGSWIHQLALFLALILLAVAPSYARPQGDLSAYQDRGEHLHTLQNELGQGWVAAEPRIVPIDPVQRVAGEVLAIASRPFDEEWDPRAAPGEAERVSSLRIVGARGAYASTSFIIYAFEDLDDLEVKVQIEPTDAEAPWIEVRRVVSLWTTASEAQRTARPMEAALVLGPTQVPAGRSQRYLVQAWLDDEQAPGSYSGEVVVRLGDQTVASLPLTVEVLGFTLPDPPVTYALWYRPISGRVSADAIAEDFALMREHGINSAILTHANPELRVSRGQPQVTFFQLDQIVQGYLRAGLTGPIGIDVRYIAGWANRYAEAVHAADGDLSQVRSVEGAYAVQPFDDPLTQETFLGIISSLLEYAEERNWPELFLFAQEEAWTADELAQLAYFTPLLKEAGAQTLLVTNRAIFGAANETELFGDLWDAHAYRGLTPELLDEAQSAEWQLWGYNLRDRLGTGLHSMAVGVENMSHWAFMWPPLSPYTMLPISSYFYGAFPSLYGPVVSPSLVRMREGIDDTRYLRYLQEFSPEGRERAQAILDLVPITYDDLQAYNELHWGGELAALREHMISSILALESGRTLPDLPPSLTVETEQVTSAGRTVVSNGDFSAGNAGGIPQDWRYLHAADGPGRVALDPDAAAGEEGGYGVRFVLNEPGDEIAYLAQRLDIDALRGKRVQVAISFRFRSGGGSLYARLRQWRGSEFVGDAARVWANSPTGSSLEIASWSGPVVGSAERGITNFHDVWFTAVSEGVVAENAGSMEIYFGVEKRAGTTLELDVDSVYVYVLEEDTFSAQPLRRVVSSCTAAVPVAVQIPEHLVPTGQTLAYRWDAAGDWTTVPLRASGSVLHIPLEPGAGGERSVEVRLGDEQGQAMKVFVVPAACGE